MAIIHMNDLFLAGFLFVCMFLFCFVLEIEPRP